MTTAPSKFLAVHNVPCRPPTERTEQLAAVAMLQNSDGVIQVSTKNVTEAPDKVLLDTGAQPILLGSRFANLLKIGKNDMQSDKVMITTATGSIDNVVGITKHPLLITFNSHDPAKRTSFSAICLITKATTYDILLGTEILIPLGLAPAELDAMECAKHWERIYAARMSFPVIGHYRAAQAWSPDTFQTQ
eukprot:SM000048S16585  [mRNA]  locus=s48:515608:516654:+ [translate_table: standard]